jgi:Tol biopolymer transport system component
MNNSEQGRAMKRLSYRRMIVLLAGLVLISTGCTKRFWPSEQGFPDGEIVFAIVAETTSDSYLGFMRADGTNVITHTILPGAYEDLPVWSPTGDSIAFKWDPGSSGMLDRASAGVVSADGRMLGDCPEWGWPSGRVSMTAKGQVLMPLLLRAENREEDREGIVLADPKSCKVISILYRAAHPAQSEMLLNPSLSTEGLLALNSLMLRETPLRPEMLIVDPSSGAVQVIGEGLAPTWSPDGGRLAFIGDDGVYVLNIGSGHATKVAQVSLRGDILHRAPSTVSWSPDGESLVYHRLTPSGPIIYRLDLETGKETELYRGGAHPDWRWGAPSVGD